MVHVPDKAVSSLYAIISSIESDYQVYRWFSFLVSQRAIQSRLSDSPESQAAYRGLKKARRHQAMIYFFGMAVVGFLVLRYGGRFLLVSAAFAYPLLRLYGMKKRCVGAIAGALLTKDFGPNELSRKTLYQICESYAQECGIPSLVDALCAVDALSRRAAASAAVVGICIYFLAPVRFYGLIIASTLLAYIFVSVAPIGKRPR